MRVVKPLTQSLLHRKFDYAKKSYLSIVSAVLFDFRTQTLCSEQDLWKLFGEESIPQFDVEVLDLIGKKKSPEIIVNAYAYGKYAKDGKTTVEIKLNNVSKKLNVWGDRYWIDGHPSKAQDFEKVAINWKNAYGGVGFDKNPKGKGRDYVDVEELKEKLKLVPNIENPAESIIREGREYEPVTFTSLPMEYPERNKLMGTYDDKWREEEFPGLARDVDWAYFNQSPKDQRLSKLEVGDEAVFVNMHPDKAESRMKIPSMRHRAFLRFVKESEKGESFLHPIDLSLTTLWAFPHLEKAFLIYEGVVEIERWFFVDDIVSDLMGAIEHIERPKPLSYYEEVFKLRTDENLSMYYASVDSQLTDKVFLSPAERIPVSHSLKNKLKRLAEDLKVLEQDLLNKKNEFSKLDEDIEEIDTKALLTEVFGGEVKSLDDVSEWLDKGLDPEKENQKQLEEELQGKSFCAQNREQRKELKASSEKIKQDSLKMTREEFLLAQKENSLFIEEARAESKLSVEKASELLEELRKDKAVAKFIYGYTPEQLIEYQASSSLWLARNFKQVGKESLSQDFEKANFQIIKEKSDKKNAWLEKLSSESIQYPSGFFSDEPVEREILISSLDFFLEESDELKSGATFVLKAERIDDGSYQEARIFDVQLNECHFYKCDFSNTQLSNAVFRQCTFSQCQFIATEIQKSYFDNCQFVDCEFVGSEIEKTAFNKVQFEGAVIDKCDFDVCTLNQLGFKESKFEMTDFTRSRLWSVEWSACSMKQLSFTMGLLKKISFLQTEIESLSVVVNSIVKQLIFVECHLSKIFIKTKTKIDELRIERSLDKDSSWRELFLRNVSIAKSQLEGNDYSKSTFTQSKFLDTSFKDSLWMGSVLDHVLLENVDFAEAVMMGLRTESSHFKHVSFFTAELSYIDIDDQTVFDDCYMDRANTVPSLRG